MASLGSLITTFGANLDPLDRAVIKAESQFLKVQRQGINSFNKITKTVFSLRSAIAGIGLTALAKKFIDTSDSLLLIEGRLKLVTDSTEELAQVEDRLYKVSARARGSYSATAELYARIGRTTKELNISQTQLLRVTETINKAMIVSGASATEANAAMIQLSQGLASGALRGDELRSVLEQTPRLAQAMADGMNIPIGKLRELGAEGKLTSEIVINALLSQTKVIDDEFSKMPVTVGQAVTVMMNNINRIFGYLNKNFGIVDMISTKILTFANMIMQSKDEIIDFVERGVRVLITTMHILIKVTEAYIAIRLGAYFFTAATFAIKFAGSLSTLAKSVGALRAMSLTLMKTSGAAKGGIIGLFLFGFYEGFKWLFDKFDIVKEFMFSLIGTIMSLFEQAKFGIINSWKYVYYGIVEVLSSIIKELNKFINWATSGLPGWLKRWLGIDENTEFKPLVNPYEGLAEGLNQELEDSKKILQKRLDEIDDMVINAMLGVRLPDEITKDDSPKIDFGEIDYSGLEDFSELMKRINELLNAEDPTKVMKFTQDKLRAYQSMYEDMGEYSTRFYENERKMIAIQAKEYKKAGVAPDMIKDWTAFQERELKKSELVDTGGFFGGMQSGLMELEDNYNKSFSRMGEFGKSTFEDIYQSFEDTIYHGLSGDFDSISDLWEDTWDNMTKSALRMFSQMLMEMAMKKAIMPAISSIGSGIAGFFGAMGGVTASAHGNVFSHSKIVPFAHGGIVTKPTIFPMARGAGLMGEAGPEGILPLKRIGGDLGVKATLGTPVINIYNNVGAEVTTKERKTAGGIELDVMIDAAVANKLRQQGSQSNKAVRQNFGARTRLTGR